jgi:hypothetical protein
MRKPIVFSFQHQLFTYIDQEIEWVVVAALPDVVDYLPDVTITGLVELEDVQNCLCSTGCQIWINLQECLRATSWKFDSKIPAKNSSKLAMFQV